jgi:flagellar hook-associated protein 1 FlgK
MGTLTALLDLTQNSLQASQAAIDITSNNVANANAPGYTDEVATFQEADSVSLSGTASSGQGVSVSAVSQRDPVLNQRVQQQTQAESASSAESTALSDLQSIFGITSTTTSAISTTIGTDINSFFSSLSSLEASPSSTEVRQGVISAAGTLAADFNTASNQIAQQTSSLNQQVTGVVSEVNSLTSSIAALNLQIESTSPNSDAGTLEDQRQEDLTQLSQYIGFDQTKTENNGLTLTTGTGQLLVSEGQSSPLTTSSTTGNTDVISGSGVNITSTLTGGSLGGIIQARDTDLPKVSTALDSLAYAIGTNVNTQNAKGLIYDVLNPNGTNGSTIFNLPTTSAGAASTISATTDPDAIAAAAAATPTTLAEGSSGDTNATALSSLANSTMVSGQTAPAFYASMLTQLGSTVSQVSNENTTQQASLTQLTTQQSTESSVSLDQEAANLTLYERSYDAAAKVFTIVDELMASALNLGEETTVS